MLALFSFWPFLNWFFVHEIQLQVSVLNFSASFLVHEIILGISNLICSLGYNHDLSSLLPVTRSAALDQLIHFWDEMRWCAMCIRDHHHHLCFTFKTSFWSKMVERFWKFVPKRISKLAHYSKVHILSINPINPILRYLNVCTHFSQNFFYMKNLLKLTY